MSMYTVRRANEKDIPRILDLLVQVDMVHHNGRPDLFKGPATKYNEAELSNILKDDKMFVFVCVNEDDYVCAHGFCIEKQVVNDNVLTDVRTLYIDDICVDETCRGQNVGKILYEHIHQFAKEMKFYNITLNVWSCNPSAKKFYEKMGLRPQKICMETIIYRQGED